MRRRLEMDIATCEECPWCKYDGYYSMSCDSGYDCTNPNATHSRLVNDSDVNSKIFYNKKPKGWPPIPDWCPLPMEVLA